MTGRLLVVDDEANVRVAIRGFFEDEGHTVHEAASVAEARAAVESTAPDLVLLDVRMPSEDGMTLLREMGNRHGAPLVLMMSGQATIELAVQATRMGAYDFLEKPPDPRRWSLAVRNALEVRRLRVENQGLRGGRGLEALLGESPPMVELRRQVERVGTTLGRVLVLGENGTGKELVATALHELSPRVGGSFVKLNCAALPRELVESELFGHEKGAFTGAVSARPGKLELAQGGTLFLDEIGDLSQDSQAKLLRALETGEFERLGGSRPQRTDARVISATNKDLPSLIRSGEFREDLFFRLNVVPLRVPPLRERGGDIAALARHYAGYFSSQHGRPEPRLSAEAIEVLEHYRWPGNVRELRNLMERLVILSPNPDVDAAAVERALPEPAESPASGLRSHVEAAERDTIARTLAETGWNVSAAAERLGLDRGSLHRKLRKYGLHREG